MADPDRKLPASARKMQRARADGNVPRSRDLGHLLALATMAGVVWFGARPLTGWAGQLLVDGLTFDATQVTRTGAMAEQLAALGLRALMLILPLGLLMIAAGVLTAIISGGWNFSSKAFAFNFSRLNPISGLGNLVSRQQLINVAKMWLLAILLSAVGGWYLYSRAQAMESLLRMPLPQAVQALGVLIGMGLALLLLVIGVVALIDVPLQRFLWADRLKMTLEEAKREAKDIEGNPEVKNKIKAKMRELARRRMIAAVPSADLVVMNPTHYAVALAYDEGHMRAPRVVAKGADLLAMRIRAVARQSQVPVLQSPALARALYAHVPLDGEVPAALFAAVATVLAWVYQLREAPERSWADPQVDVPAGLDPGPGAVEPDALDVEADA